MNIIIILLILIILASWYLAIGLYKRVKQYEAKLVLAQVTIDDLTTTCNAQFDQLQDQKLLMQNLVAALPKTKKISDYLSK